MVYFYEDGKDGVRIRDAWKEDIDWLQDRLRPEDEEEVIAAGFKSAREALLYSFEKSSVCLCVDIGGNPAALFGIVPDSLLGDSANIWFLGAAEMNDIKKTFLKLSRRFIADFLLQYPRLHNFVDGRYKKTFRWLEACGAKFGKKPVMSNGIEFFPFVIGRS